MKAEEAGRKTIQVMNSTVNITVLTIIMLLIAFAGYALWDSEQINSAADKFHYEIYKPTVENEGKSFQELQALNPDVAAWLHVYGTNIDYPITQGRDNIKYVNTNAEGLYSLSGAIFLDYHNSKDFSDFNSILYGHHMDKKTMFGEIGDFAKKSMFDSHGYARLYFNKEDHGIEFFAFIHTSAYDDAVFTPNVQGNRKQEYLDDLLANAIYKKDIGVTTEDRIILLTTCSSSSTNGRDVLVGRISDKTYINPFLDSITKDETKQSDNQNGLVKQIRLINLILIFLLIVLVLVIYYRRKNRKGAESYDQNI
ncbi:MAG: class B sortase [Oscillospiraceae bacterium]|nr:class B sortase [Oscillospiraceae bacterium]